nr:uncharacterized protein LOC112424734 [Macaca nemestrina]
MDQIWIEEGDRWERGKKGGKGERVRKVLEDSDKGQIRVLAALSEPGRAPVSLHQKEDWGRSRSSRRSSQRADPRLVARVDGLCQALAQVRESRARWGQTLTGGNRESEAAARRAAGLHLSVQTCSMELAVNPPLPTLGTSQP